MALPTWVDSLNGYTSGNIFSQDYNVEIDANDIHVTGSTGTTVKAKVQSLANSMVLISVEDIGTSEQKRLRIGKYNLSLRN